MNIEACADAKCSLSILLHTTSLLCTSAYIQMQVYMYIAMMIQAFKISITDPRLNSSLQNQDLAICMHMKCMVTDKK